MITLLKKKNNFLFLTILTFVFVASVALSLSNKKIIVIKNFQAISVSQKTFPPIPIINTPASYPVLSSQGVLAVDLDSGIRLYEKNPDLVLLPASTTKIVTALVALENYKLDDILTVPKFSVVGQKMGLVAGEQIKFEDLLYGLLVYSANDAAETLAMNYTGGRDAFINAMNIKAKEINMTNSKFQNPVGLDNSNQISTARDLVLASEIAMRNPEFAKIVGTKSADITDITGKHKYHLTNINELLGTVPGVMGIKTGWTENARENLVSYINRDNHRIIIAVLGSQDRFGETKELIDWIFTNYSWNKVDPVNVDNNQGL